MPTSISLRSESKTKSPYLPAVGSEKRETSLQTLQPFALADSLAARKLGQPKITILDISPRVRFHILGAIRNAKPYVIQLPRNKTPWLPGALEYWKHFGDALALPAPAIAPPANAA